jgi:hypothetical protein
MTAALGKVSIFDNLESRDWQVAGGTLADSNPGAPGQPTADGSHVAPGANNGYFEIAPHAPYADRYWYLEFGADPQKTTFRYDLRMLLATAADVAAPQQIELDLQQCIGGKVFNMGWGFGFQSGELRVWNRSGKAWVDTGVPMPRLTPGAWFNVSTEMHRDGDNVYHDAITINGSRIIIAKSFPAPTLGLKDMLNGGFQLDSNFRGAPYRCYVNNMRITAW